ncbi:MAG: mandelate racemase/muconate lactonizing enzyme family protein, partial [Phycisphaerae bacterium]
MAGWFGIGGDGAPGSIKKVRFAAVLGVENPANLRRLIKLARLYGLRDFKVKLGNADPQMDWARLEAALAVLRRPLAAAKASLRVDVNGAWQPNQAAEIMAKMRDLPITAVEQPTPPGTEDAWPDLYAKSGLAIWADESVSTLQDARYLAQGRLAAGLNVRISKCGGLSAAVRLAELSKQQDLTLMIGCMVGETAILSAALVQLLMIIDNAAFAEGCYGRLLLRKDVGRRVQFGYGGKVPRV